MIIYSLCTDFTHEKKTDDGINTFILCIKSKLASPKFCKVRLWRGITPTCSPISEITFTPLFNAKPVKVDQTQKISQLEKDAACPFEIGIYSKLGLRFMSKICHVYH